MRRARRRFIQAGAAGAVLLALVAFVDRPRAQSSPGFRHLEPRGVELLQALIPVVLAGALPTGAERSTAIAETLGISRNSVKTHLQRGLAALEERLSADAALVRE